MTAQRWFRIRLGCAAFSFAVFAVAVVVIGSLTPGYSQWSDAVSRLASPGEPWAVAARAVFAAYGLLVIAGASTLRRYAGRHGRWLVRCLVLYGIACVVAGVAPKDQPGAAHTLVSQVHVDASIGAGALAIGAMALVAACGLTRAGRRTAAATALLTGVAAGFFRFTWGTGVYGVRPVHPNSEFPHTILNSSDTFVLCADSTRTRRRAGDSSGPEDPGVRATP
jgi:hypothetical protein